MNAVPPTILCGGRHTRRPKHTLEMGKGHRVPHPYPHPEAPWMTHLLENNLWVGRGRTRSQLHFDKENIVNCLFHGEKRWTLIDTVSMLEMSGFASSQMCLCVHQYRSGSLLRHGTSLGLG